MQSFVACCTFGAAFLTVTTRAADTKSEAKDQHAAIGAVESKDIYHNTNSDAQWFPPAGFGLFLHWGLAAVRGGEVVHGGDLSWAMQPKGLMNRRIGDSAERERIIRERDWDLNGKPHHPTPNEYWALAKDFNPQDYDPDKWCAAAKAAGFTYAVLTTRHHDGFALWPSAYGDFSTKNFMGGRDLVKPFVEACRKYGLKVGLYYSPPNWHFDRDYMDFLYWRARQKNPEFPKLDADLNPQMNQPTANELQRHNAAVDAMVKGQVEELLTRYGKIDYLWFDGGPSSGNRQCITRERIQELQPGIVIGPRLHGKGDLITFEGNTVTDGAMKKAASLHGWAEWCLTWTSWGWSYHKGLPLAADGWVLSRLASARSLGVNMLLDLGPTEQGELDAEAYKHMADVTAWMKVNGIAVHEAMPLPAGETASVPATALGQTRYLFACPKFTEKGGGVAFDKDMISAQDETLTLSGIGPVKSVKLLGDGKDVAHDYVGKTLTIHLPAARRTKLPDVVAVEFVVSGESMSPAETPAPLTVQITPSAPAQSGYFKMGTSRQPSGHQLGVDSNSLWLDGQRWLPVMGEFQYARYPETEWRDELLKMKAGGVDIVATYVFWIHHEEIEGQWDWSGQRDLRKFVQLCGEVGLKVVVRCGPWAHGEARNGSFPDWVVAHKDWKLRSTDANFLGAVKTLYGQIAEQLSGQLWKDGGPVIGIQMDNEFHGSSAYLLELKKIALDAGLDVPFYTRTGWPTPTTPVPLGDLIPLFGSYGNNFWDRSIAPELGSKWARFRFAPMRTDSGIGTDLLGKQKDADTDDAEKYPYATCEIGGGMATSYHRRVLIQPSDCLALASVQIGSGDNLPGYYLYHGGCNPDGRLSTLNESQATGYPNDLPAKNYDFQAPLGEFGEIHPSYHPLRRLHLFLRDYGARLAAMPAYFPEVNPTRAEQTNLLRWAVRCDSHAGFVFVNNYQQVNPLPDHRDVKFDLQLPSGNLLFPRQAVTIPSGACFFWPVNFDLGGVNLIYATAQPICQVDDNGTRTIFFAQVSGVSAEFAFAENEKITVATGELETQADRMFVSNIKPSLDAAMVLSAADGQIIRIVLLDEDDSLALWKGSWQGRDRVVLSRAGVMFDGDSLRLNSTTVRDLKAAVFPAPSSVVFESSKLKGQTAGIFTRYEPAAKKSPLFQATLKQIQPAGRARQIPLGKGKTPVAVAPSDADFAQAAVWRVTLPDGLDFLRNPILRFYYIGDVARVMLNGRLVQDDFYNGNYFDVGLGRLASELPGAELQLAILPLRKDAPIYLDPLAKPDFGDMESLVKLQKTELITSSEVTLRR